MIVLEDTLRSAFTDAVQQPPGIAEPAGAAIRRAGSVRRWHRTVAGAAVLAAAVGLVGGLAWVQDWRISHSGGGLSDYVQEYESPPVEPARPMSAAPPPAEAQGPPPALDLVASGLLVTAEGQKVRLAAGPAVATAAYRLPIGWLVDEGGRLSLVRVGAAAAMLTEADSWTVNADGTRLAYVLGTRLHVADLALDGLHPLTDTAVPSGTRAVTFLGGRVVLAAVADGRITGYDHWSTTEPYVPTWTDKVRAVYGTRGDTLVGLAVGPLPGTVCLAKLTVAADGFQVAETAGCDLELGAANTLNALSPDGRWLAVRRSATVAFYDLDTVFETQRSAAACPVPAAPAAPRPVTAGAPSWEGWDSVLVVGTGGAVRCRTNGTVERVAVPADAPVGWLFVARSSLSFAK